MAKSGLIKTPRLIIEPFAFAHISEQYVSWLNDAVVTQFSDQQFSKHTTESCQAYCKSFEGTPNYFWAIVAKDTIIGHIGTATAYVDEHHAVADIGILIGQSREWRKGYASEAWLGLCDYLFRSARIRKVTAGTIEPNVGMIKIMDRAGMVDDGRRLRQCLWNGQEVDQVHKALFRETWLLRYRDSPFRQSELSQNKKT